MSIDASAELIFGIPIARYNEDGETTDWWSGADEGWRNDLGPVLEIVPFGHYKHEAEDTQAILSIKSVPSYSGDCYEATEIAPNFLHVSDTALREAKAALAAHGLGPASHGPTVSFNDARWYLVASVG